MSLTRTKMRSEIEEIPVAAERLLTTGWGAVEAAADAAREHDPAVLVSVARGSSDHACTYLKYAFELLLGLPVASIGPSVASLYKAPLRLERAACLAVSQSGKSPDIVEMAKACRRDGALTFALTNNPSSPLADISSHTLDIHAGPELSVAATKTFLNSALAGVLMLGLWKRDDQLLAAIKSLPEKLARSAEIDWPEVRAAIGTNASLFTLGRGLTLAMSNEAALKFKETCQLHAESYSSAEVMHGPVSIVEDAFPVLGFAAADAAEKALADTSDTLALKGARVFSTTSAVNQARELPCVRTGHPVLDPLALIVSFYSMVEAFATSKGIDPDTPRHLNKVTETV